VSSSVGFLLAALGLSVVGSLVVWLTSRPRSLNPRRSQTTVEQFNRQLQALSSDERSSFEPPSGVTPIRPDEATDRGQSAGT
jgi:hypothetical protein